jgi:hypothetical protein
MTKTARVAKLQDKLIESIYRQHCSGMQISILRIPELFRMARKMLDAGATDQEVGRAMVDFVNADEKANVS